MTFLGRTGITTFLKSFWECLSLLNLKCAGPNFLSWSHWDKGYVTVAYFVCPLIHARVAQQFPTLQEHLTLPLSVGFKKQTKKPSLNTCSEVKELTLYQIFRLIKLSHCSFKRFCPSITIACLLDKVLLLNYSTSKPLLNCWHYLTSVKKVPSRHIELGFQDLYRQR